MVAPVPLGAPVATATGILDTVTLTYPSGLQIGDTLVCLVYGDAGAAQTISDYGGVTLGPAQPQFVKATATGVRRGVAAYIKSVNYFDLSQLSGDITWVTSAGIGIIGGAVMAFRGGINSLTPTDIYEGVVSAGITSGTTPAPASFTTTATDRLALSLVAWNNTNTISDIHANGWNDGYGAVNDGTNSYDFQYVVVPSATTLSGGTATLGATGNWGVITLGLKPLYPAGVDPVDPPFGFAKLSG